MKKLRKITKIFTALFLVLLILPVKAAEDNTSSLVVHFAVDEKSEVSAVGELYYVAEYDREHSSFTVAEPFNQYQITFENTDEEDWRSLATTLLMYVERDGLQPSHSSSMDMAGDISFDGCVNGLYLFVAKPFSDGNYLYTPQPFLIVLPEYDSQTGTAEYHVQAEGKYEREEVKEEVTSLEIVKVWKDDDEANRPVSIVVQLVGDGFVQEEIELSKENNWRWKFENLPINVNWAVVEKDVPEGYTVRIEKENSIYVISNTGEETPPEEPDLPQTGMLLWPIPILVGIGLLLVIAGVYRKRHE